MKKREKILLIATLGVSAVGVISWLSESPPRGAAQSEEVPAKPNADQPRYLAFAPKKLTALLARAREERTTASDLDLFAGRAPGSSASYAGSGALKGGSLRVRGVFHSSSVQGALIDDHVRFEGDVLAPGTKLKRVREDGVEIERDGRILFIQFDPRVSEEPK